MVSDRIRTVANLLGDNISAPNTVYFCLRYSIETLQEIQKNLNFQFGDNIECGTHIGKGRYQQNGGNI